ncbi:hypothetical protein CBR_g22311 [Chara braunii]|uniref:PHD-type domain-containing protein n=1 Tax=Chara braunii TaxID=69332 RepID=A0A388L2Y3_CHABU|nr:hypothetical protein CBR_g22311 [Chara braunii]|eukprot:GBG76563.1 hypothetical protein CBR_g22311 [Chara braunii]
MAMRFPMGGGAEGGNSRDSGRAPGAFGIQDVYNRVLEALLSAEASSSKEQNAGIEKVDALTQLPRVGLIAGRVSTSSGGSDRSGKKNQKQRPRGKAFGKSKSREVVVAISKRAVPSDRTAASAGAGGAVEPTTAAVCGAGAGSGALALLEGLTSHQPQSQGLSHHPPPPLSQSFWGYVSDYFRDVSVEDIELLQPPPNPLFDPAFTIPPAGQHYTEVWAKEDAEQEQEEAGKQLANKVKRKLLSASPVSKKRKIAGGGTGGGGAGFPAAATPTSAAAVVTTVLSPLEDDTDDVCHVCYGGESEEANQIIFCDNCNVPVHQDCYGVQEVPEGPWLCSGCLVADGGAAPGCVLCPKVGGAVKPVVDASADHRGGGGESRSKKKYAHLFCAQWVPETYIEDPKIREPVRNVEAISKERWKLLCVICKEKHGACIQCSHGMCATAFHPLCAREARYRMEVSSRADVDEVELRAFCQKHSSLRNSKGPQGANTNASLAARSQQQVGEKVEEGCPQTTEGPVGTTSASPQVATGAATAAVSPPLPDPGSANEGSASAGCCVSHDEAQDGLVVPDAGAGTAEGARSGAGEVAPQQSEQSNEKLAEQGGWEKEAKGIQVCEQREKGDGGVSATGEGRDAPSAVDRGDSYEVNGTADGVGVESSALGTASGCPEVPGSPSGYDPWMERGERGVQASETTKPDDGANSQYGAVANPTRDPLEGEGPATADGTGAGEPCVWNAAPADQTVPDPVASRVLDACDTNELVKLLKRVMHITRITQTLVAHQSGVSQSTLSTFLQGRPRTSHTVNNKVRDWLSRHLTAQQDEDANLVWACSLETMASKVGKGKDGKGREGLAEVGSNRKPEGRRSRAGLSDQLGTVLPGSFRSTDKKSKGKVIGKKGGEGDDPTLRGGDGSTSVLEQSECAVNGLEAIPAQNCASQAGEGKAAVPVPPGVDRELAVAASTAPIVASNGRPSVQKVRIVRNARGGLAINPVVNACVDETNSLTDDRVEGIRENAEQGRSNVFVESSTNSQAEGDPTPGWEEPVVATVDILDADAASEDRRQRATNCEASTSGSEEPYRSCSANGGGQSSTHNAYGLHSLKEKTHSGVEVRRSKGFREPRRNQGEDTNSQGVLEVIGAAEMTKNSLGSGSGVACAGDPSSPQRENKLLLRVSLPSLANARRSRNVSGDTAGDPTSEGLKAVRPRVSVSAAALKVEDSGQSEVKAEPKPVVKAEPKLELLKAEMKPELKPVLKPELKLELKPEVTPELKMVEVGDYEDTKGNSRSRIDVADSVSQVEDKDRVEHCPGLSETDGKLDKNAKAQRSPCGNGDVRRSCEDAEEQGSKCRGRPPTTDAGVNVKHSAQQVGGCSERTVVKVEVENTGSVCSDRELSGSDCAHRLKASELEASQNGKRWWNNGDSGLRSMGSKDRSSQGQSRVCQGDGFQSQVMEGVGDSKGERISIPRVSVSVEEEGADARLMCVSETERGGSPPGSPMPTSALTLPSGNEDDAPLHTEAGLSGADQVQRIPEGHVIHMYTHILLESLKPPVWPAWTDSPLGTPVTEVCEADCEVASRGGQRTVEEANAAAVEGEFSPKYSLLEGNGEVEFSVTLPPPVVPPRSIFHPSRQVGIPSGRCNVCVLHKCENCGAESAPVGCLKRAKSSSGCPPGDAFSANDVPLLQAAQDSGYPMKARCVGLVVGADLGEVDHDMAEDDSLAKQLEKLDIAHHRGLLDAAPEDEIVGEMLILQNQLLLSMRANRVRCERLLRLILPALPEQLRAAQEHARNKSLVNQYLLQMREIKKQGRKEKREKEAQAHLAAVTAAVVASPRLRDARREPVEQEEETVKTPSSVATPSSQNPSLQNPHSVTALALQAWPASPSPGAAPSHGTSPNHMSFPQHSAAVPKLLKPPLPRPPRVSTAVPTVVATAALGPSVRTDVKPVYDMLPSSKRDDAEAVCAVCGNRDSEAANSIIFCDRCGVAVHPKCYGGMGELPAAGIWLCQPCAEQRRLYGDTPPAECADGRSGPGVQCALCPGRTGAFKRSTDNRWVHVFCAQWMPETSVGRQQTAMVEGLKEVTSERFNLLCQLCKEHHGACLRCNFGHCHGAFHPSCARNSGLFMSLKVCPGGRTLLRAYCQRHSPVQRVKVQSKIRGGPEDMAVLKKIRVEFERLRLICERVVRREKLKREMLQCRADVYAAQLAVAVEQGASNPVVMTSWNAIQDQQHWHQIPPPQYQHYAYATAAQEQPQFFYTHQQEYAQTHVQQQHLHQHHHQQQPQQQHALVSPVRMLPQATPVGHLSSPWHQTLSAVPVDEPPHKRSKHRREFCGTRSNHPNHPELAMLRPHTRQFHQDGGHPGSWGALTTSVVTEAGDPGGATLASPTTASTLTLPLMWKQYAASASSGIPVVTADSGLCTISTPTGMVHRVSEQNEDVTTVVCLPGRPGVTPEALAVTRTVPVAGIVMPGLRQNMQQEVIQALPQALSPGVTQMVPHVIPQSITHVVQQHTHPLATRLGSGDSRQKRSHHDKDKRAGRKHKKKEKGMSERLMTPSEANAQNSRLPKGYIYMPVASLLQPMKTGAPVVTVVPTTSSMDTHHQLPQHHPHAFPRQTH